ncbi:MAG: hypothetical protein IT316_02490, partial [Anaerolineales bacterium]|nr:hypothetical protein [Anaerolineales bacterium]
GIPVRLTVSERARQAGGIEFKRRDLAQKEIVAESDVVEYVLQTLRGLSDELETRAA